MSDKVLIYAGLLLFLAVVTFPFWQGIAAHSSMKEPDVRKATGKSCVAPTRYMREAHMALLMTWRDAKVRGQQRTYTASDGTVYAINLSGTCLTRCHGSKDDFCDRCHTFAGVATPNCWGCHLSPPATKTGMTAATGRNRL